MMGKKSSEISQFLLLLFFYLPFLLFVIYFFSNYK